MLNKCLLGISKDKKIIFLEIDIISDEKKQDKLFYSNFQQYSVQILNYEECLNYIEDLLDTTYTPEEKYNLCLYYDCAPSDLSEFMLQCEGICIPINKNNYYALKYEGDLDYEQAIIIDNNMLDNVDSDICAFFCDFYKKYSSNYISKKIENEIIGTYKKLESLTFSEFSEQDFIEYYIHKYIFN